LVARGVRPAAIRAALAALSRLDDVGDMDEPSGQRLRGADAAHLYISPAILAGYIATKLSCVESRNVTYAEAAQKALTAQMWAVSFSSCPLGLICGGPHYVRCGQYGLYKA